MSTNSPLPFGKNLSKIMKEREFRIQDVASIAGVGKSVVHSWITGTTPRDLHAVKKLADALDIQFVELLMSSREPQTGHTELVPLDESPIFEGICRVRIERLQSGPKRK
jgi:transcriptional regulator with XRE-family HTH domain